MIVFFVAKFKVMDYWEVIKLLREGENNLANFICRRFLFFLLVSPCIFF